jgi:hypothetical protein
MAPLMIGCITPALKIALHLAFEEANHKFLVTHQALHIMHPHLEF